MQRNNLFVFTCLCMLFLFYSFTIYLQPLYTPSIPNINITKASEGRLVWQKYNCQACHQLYGLGGYLGPDLTNIYSKKGNGEILIRAMINSGTLQMPIFKIPERELLPLLEFLKMTDASGTSDPRNYRQEINGLINHK